MSWDELLSIYKEGSELHRIDREQPPLSCPNDGEPLLSDNKGGLYCKFDGYRWPRDGK